jgi:hypothetical protein
MIKPDVLVAWPVHLDYPLWRQFIHDNRSRFEKVIIVFTQMNTGKDYSTWLTEQFNQDRIISTKNDEVLGYQDWRNVAVNKGLSYSDAEWIWFTEQDFFLREDFWDTIDWNNKSHTLFGYYQQNRLHPCCILITRAWLNKTNKNFGVVKDSLDHFGILQKELEDFNIPTGIISHDYGEHLNGLSQNMYLLQIGEKPNYEPEKFKEYCQKCLAINLPIHPEIKKLMKDYVNL